MLSLPLGRLGVIHHAQHLQYAARHALLARKSEDGVRDLVVPEDGVDRGAKGSGGASEPGSRCGAGRDAEVVDGDVILARYGTIVVGRIGAY